MLGVRGYRHQSRTQWQLWRRCYIRFGPEAEVWLRRKQTSKAHGAFTKVDWAPRANSPEETETWVPCRIFSSLPPMRGTARATLPGRPNLRSDLQNRVRGSLPRRYQPSMISISSHSETRLQTKVESSSWPNANTEENRLTRISCSNARGSARSFKREKALVPAPAPDRPAMPAPAHRASMHRHGASCVHRWPRLPRA